MTIKLSFTNCDRERKKYINKRKAEKTMKKKLITIISAALICAAFTGCGDNTSSPANSTENSAASAPQNSAASGSTNSAANSEAGSNAAAGGLADKTEALKNAVETPEMVAVNNDSLKDILGVDSADVAEFSALNCGNGAYPDAFGIFTAKDEDSAKRVEEALKKFVEKRNKDFKDYKPAEMYKLEDSFVETNGTTVVFAICADNSKAKEILK